MDIPFTAEFLNGLGVVGLCVLFLLLLVFDKGITLKSRVTDRDNIIAKQDATIESQRESLAKKDEYIADLLVATRTSANAMEKFGLAAEQVAGGGDS